MIIDYYNFLKQYETQEYEYLIIPMHLIIFDLNTQQVLSVL